jgi:hypothetical protein
MTLIYSVENININKNRERKMHLICTTKKDFETFCDSYLQGKPLIDIDKLITDFINIELTRNVDKYYREYLQHDEIKAKYKVIANSMYVSHLEEQVKEYTKLKDAIKTIIEVTK